MQNRRPAKARLEAKAEREAKAKAKARREAHARAKVMQRNAQDKPENFNLPKEIQKSEPQAEFEVQALEPQAELPYFPYEFNEPIFNNLFPTDNCFPTSAGEVDRFSDLPQDGFNGLPDLSVDELNGELNNEFFNNASTPPYDFGLELTEEPILSNFEDDPLFPEVSQNKASYINADENFTKIAPDYSYTSDKSIKRPRNDDGESYEDEPLQKKARVQKKSNTSTRATTAHLGLFGFILPENQTGVGPVITIVSAEFQSTLNFSNNGA